MDRQDRNVASASTRAHRWLPRLLVLGLLVGFLFAFGKPALAQGPVTPTPKPSPAKPPVKPAPKPAPPHAPARPSTAPRRMNTTTGAAMMTVTGAGGINACLETALPSDDIFDDPPNPGNDDGSSPDIPLSFPLNFFGTTYNDLYVNNNGNLSFT